MAGDLPSGTILAVLRRAGVAPGRGSTEAKWCFPCTINPAAHAHADRHPSGYAIASSNIVGCPVCGTLTAKQAAEHLNVSWPEVLEEVRAQSAGSHRTAHRATAADRPQVAPSGRTFPPRSDVLAVWESAGRLYDDLAIRAQLRERAIDVGHATDRDLARVLIGEHSLPSWARYQGRDWRALGRRLVVGLYDATGSLATLHARRLVGQEDGVPKGLSPAGYTHSGTVMADPLGQILLATGTAPAWWQDRTVVVAEGGPDFLTWSTHYGDSEHAPAVLGVISGSWTAALAARIPSSCRVIVRTHEDDAGNRYGLQIAKSLVDRCEVLVPPGVVEALKVQK